MRIVLLPRASPELSGSQRSGGAHPWESHPLVAPCHPALQTPALAAKPVAPRAQAQLHFCRRGARAEKLLLISPAEPGNKWCRATITGWRPTKGRRGDGERRRPSAGAALPAALGPGQPVQLWAGGSPPLFPFHAGVGRNSHILVPVAAEQRGSPALTSLSLSSSHPRLARFPLRAVCQHAAEGGEGGKGSRTADSPSEAARGWDAVPTRLLGESRNRKPAAQGKPTWCRRGPGGTGVKTNAASKRTARSQKDNGGCWRLGGRAIAPASQLLCPEHAGHRARLPGYLLLGWIRGPSCLPLPTQPSCTALASSPEHKTLLCSCRRNAGAGISLLPRQSAKRSGREQSAG